MENNDTINLFDLGCLVNLKIGSWSARKMVNRKDLVNVGINPDALPGDLVNYGRKLLVSKKEIQAFTKIEQRARAYLANWSVPFFAAGAHFVPLKIVPDLEVNLSSFREEFFSTVDNFIVRFEESKEEVKTKFPEFYSKCLAPHYPASAESLRSKFTFSWNLFKIAGINALQSTTTEEVNQDNEKREALIKTMQKEVDSFVNEYINGMRSETIKFCDLMSARVNGKIYSDETEPKLLTARSLGFFRKYIDKFQTLNIFNDSEIAKMLSDFKDQFLDLGTTSKSFNNAQIKSSVSLALASIRKQAALENDQTSEFINSMKRKIII